MSDSTDAALDAEARGFGRPGAADTVAVTQAVLGALLGRIAGRAGA